MRYVVFGAGAVGGAIAARLSLAGRDVVAIARGDHLHAIQRDGMRVISPGADEVVRIDAVADPGAAEVASDDIVLLCVKSNDTEAALTALAAVAPSDVAVVCVQNAVDNERQALRRFARVYGVVVFLPAEYLEPGVVRTIRGPVRGVLDIGSVPTGADPTAEAVAADLNASGFASRPVEDVMAWKRAKLIRNLWNAIDALLGDAASEAEHVRRRAAAEARACFAAAGLDVIGDDAIRERTAVMSAPPASLSASSSRQSLARGTGSIEADYLNGEIVLLGRLHGLPTPVNAVLQRLANEFAAQRRPPGSLAPAALVSALEDAGVQL